MFFLVALIASAAMLVVAWITKESAYCGTIEELLPSTISRKVYRIASYAALVALISTVLSVAMFFIALLIAMMAG